MKATKISSVYDVINDFLYCGFNRGQIIFRGQSNNAWKLQPTLFRRFKDEPEFAWFFEKVLFGSRITGNENPHVNGYDPIEHLMCLQHFGIPTRLLDWSSDPLIALFFACYDPNADNQGSDGRFFTLDPGPYDRFDVTSSDLKKYKFPPPKTEIESSINRFQISTMHFVEPLIKNPKMRVQDGCFLFFPFGNKDPFGEVDDSSEYIDLVRFNRAYDKHVKIKNEEEGDNLAKSFLAHKDVDCNCKTRILEELDRDFGISENSILLKDERFRDSQKWYQELHEDAILRTKSILKRKAENEPRRSP